jgi:para-aminobenzoate synthetase/4-amino-4-deoxychorismate lyase
MIVERDVVVTPPLDGRILPGITRSRVLRLANAAGIETKEEPVAVSRLRRADDVFLTSSIRGIQRVASCEGVGEWWPSPVTLLLTDLLREAWLSEAREAVAVAR